MYQLRGGKVDPTPLYSLQSVETGGLWRQNTQNMPPTGPKFQVKTDLNFVRTNENFQDD